jgi:hypothetical protein
MFEIVGLVTHPDLVEQGRIWTTHLKAQLVHDVEDDLYHAHSDRQHFSARGIRAKMGETCGIDKEPVS